MAFSFCNSWFLQLIWFIARYLLLPFVPLDPVACN